MFNYQVKGIAAICLFFSLSALAASTVERRRGQYDDYFMDQNVTAREQYRDPERNPIGNILRDIMSVNIPLIYDMVKNGSSMGVNVLGGLVKVERGQEAERSGLRGPRPLSVRVLGVPIYERGVRVGYNNPQGYNDRPVRRPEDNEPDTEELPIIP